MKRLWLSATILLCATTVFCALRRATSQLRVEAGTASQALLSQTQLLAQARIQLTTLEQRVRDLKTSVAAKARVEPTTTALYALACTTRLSPAQSEQMLAELGFNWNTTGDYLIVSKQTLEAISFEAMKESSFKNITGDVLALTADERGNINALAQRLSTSYAEWAQAHLQRDEPAGKVVAQYSLPEDPAFFAALSNDFSTGIQAAIGHQRGALLLNYTRSWMSDVGMYGGPTSLKVSRYEPGDDSRMTFELTSGGGRMQTDVSPYQAFPEAFRPAFPNGWADLAKREHFRLPDSFQTSR